MTGDKQFPAHPFWDYSLMLYGRPGVAKACLALQDGYGMDVNLLLLSIWSAAEGPGGLDAADMQRLLSGTREWQARVVQPLRAVRRYCRRGSETSGDELREMFGASVMGVELEAEHVEQLMLAGLVADSPFVARPTDDAAVLAVGNLAAYCTVLQVDWSGSVRVHLGHIVTAAFPQIADARIMALFDDR